MLDLIVFSEIEIHKAILFNLEETMYNTMLSLSEELLELRDNRKGSFNWKINSIHSKHLLIIDADDAFYQEDIAEISIRLDKIHCVIGNTDLHDYVMHSKYFVYYTKIHEQYLNERRKIALLEEQDWQHVRLANKLKTSVKVNIPN